MVIQIVFIKNLLDTFYNGSRKEFFSALSTFLARHVLNNYIARGNLCKISCRSIDHRIGFTSQTSHSITPFFVLWLDKSIILENIVITLLGRKKNTNLYSEKHDKHAVYELRAYFFTACYLRTAACVHFHRLYAIS